MYKSIWISTALLIAASTAHGDAGLDGHTDKTRITVSGISAGAQMAHQLHIAYPEVFSGAGLLQGGLLDVPITP